MEIFTLPAPVALGWLQGRFGEAELLAARDTAPDVAFIWKLESLGDYAFLLAHCKALAERGTVALCARTKNPVVKSHFEKWGGRSLLTEHLPNGEIHHRLLLLPADWQRWTGKLRVTKSKSHGFFKINSRRTAKANISA